MALIEIYTRDPCPYCVLAKRLLASKGLTFTEIDLNDEPERMGEMLERADGRTTVPEIFVDGRLIGGFDELAELDRRGELDPLVA